MVAPSIVSITTAHYLTYKNVYRLKRTKQKVPGNTNGHTSLQNFTSHPDQHAVQCRTYLHLAVMPNATTPVLETDLVSWQLILLLHLPKAGGLMSHPMNNKLAEEYRDLDRTSTGQAVYSVDDIQPTNKF